MSEEPAALDNALDECLIHASSEGILLGTMLDRLGRSSFCFAALLLAVPFVQPFSLGPLTMIGGLTFMAVGWQMGMGRERPALPLETFMCSELPTWPMVAWHLPLSLRISPEGILTSA